MIQIFNKPCCQGGLSGKWSSLLLRCRGFISVGFQYFLRNSKCLWEYAFHSCVVVICVGIFVVLACHSQWFDQSFMPLLSAAPCSRAVYILQQHSQFLSEFLGNGRNRTRRVQMEELRYTAAPPFVVGPLCYDVDFKLRLTPSGDYWYHL